MKIIDKINAKLEADEPFYSFEYFPPKTDKGSANLLARLDRMSQFNPLFIDVTWGAGGSTSDRTLLISSGAQNYIGLETMMHLTCTNQDANLVKQHLQRARDEGIQNILALRGDAPAGEDEWVAKDSNLRYGSDLVRLIRKEHGDYFGIAVAGYPAGHPESESYQTDIQHLKEKVDAGADFIVSQLFFDAQVYLRWVDDCRAAGITCPILPGILPIQGYASLRHLSKMASTPVPEDILAEVEAIKADDAAIRDYGVRKAVEMLQVLYAAGIKGVHFYTLNREVAVGRILNELDLVAEAPRDLPWKPSTSLRRTNEDVRPIFWANRPKSYIMRTQSWDEFPNGRWGDSGSAAFGDLGDYHLFAVDNKKGSADELRGIWGEAPTTPDDIHAVFAAYCANRIDRLPWMEDDTLAPETASIQRELIWLNQNGILTINSQPRVNGLPSSDPVAGWGPADGYVYQKAYLEFFCAPAVLEAMESRLAGHPALQYMAVNAAGESRGNAEHVCAVTWGVFPGREIQQPTVVDPESFMVWKTEAFDLWLKKWAPLYEQGTPSRALVEDIYNSYFLVNIVDNDFIGGDIYAIFAEMFEVSLADVGSNVMTPNAIQTEVPAPPIAATS